MEYRKLTVYERSYSAALMIYRISTQYPKEEMYALQSQIRRAATSIPLNIAEGYSKRESQAEFRRYLMMAIGSSDEISVLLDFAKDLGYISENEYTGAKAEYAEIGRMLNGLIKAIGRNI